MKDSAVLDVVAAILIKGERVLACRRAPHKSSPGLWEFPGGKVEAGEDPFDALVREIQEELGIDCQVIRSFDISETEGQPLTIRLHSVICVVALEGQLTSTDHDQLRWLTISELEPIEWAKPDLPTVRRLLDIGSLAGLTEIEI